MTSSATTPVLFIHGLWMHAASRRPWVDLFAEKGYAPVATKSLAFLSRNGL